MLDKTTSGQLQHIIEIHFSCRIVDMTLQLFYKFQNIWHFPFYFFVRKLQAAVVTVQKLSRWNVTVSIKQHLLTATMFLSQNVIV